METKKPGDSNYFACSCSEGGKNECENLLSKVKKLLDAEDSNLLTKVIWSLEIDYGANITSVACDQWCGVWSQTQDIDGGTFKAIQPPVFKTEIQCDKVEHGVAATWFAYYQKFGPKRIDNQ